MRRLGVLLALIALACPSASQAACGGCKAEIVTTANANTRLFGGTDIAGGLQDWYLSNGVVQAIIDGIDTTAVSVVGGSPINIDNTSSNAVETGGTLLDLGLNGKNNDQLPQSFNTGGLSLANVFIFRQGDETLGGWVPTPSGNPCTTIGSLNASCPVEDDCAAITVYGIMLGTCKTPTDFCSTRALPKMFVRSTYKACKGKRFVDLRTEVWNKSGNNQILPIFDILLWGGRGLVPFAPNYGRGFTSPALDLSSTAAVIGALTSAPFFAAPGNDSPADGVMARNKKAGAVSYGYQSLSGEDDLDGGGAGVSVVLISGPNNIQSLQSDLVSAATLPTLLGPSLINNRSRIFTRRLLVGKRNDVASVIGDATNPDSIFADPGLISGMSKVKGTFTPAPSQEGTVTFIRLVSVPADNLPFPLTPISNAPVSSVRCKGSFSNVLLPQGNYTIHAVFPGRPDIEPSNTPLFTVTPNGATTLAGLGTTTIPPITLPKVGKLKVEVRDADTALGMPAKISLSPSPSMRRDLAALMFDNRTGMCSNDFDTSCTADATCGGGNICFRTCTNVEPQPCPPACPAGYTCASDGKCRKHACSADADCLPEGVCKAKTKSLLPESYPGGQGQLHVIYTDRKGKALVEVMPGTYTLSVSRGPEYTIRTFSGVVITNAVAPTDMTVVNGGPITLKRVVDTSGYLSADFHIHSGRSLDSSAPLEARVRSFAGEDLEVMVSTDHDINTDYLPPIKKLLLTPFITSIVGTEVTMSVSRPPYLSNSWGHINSWPSVYDANLRRGGAVEDESVSAGVIYDRLRYDTPNMLCVGGGKNSKPCTTNAQCPGGKCLDVGEQVVQMNHPRAGLGGVVNIGILDNIGYDPSAAIDNCNKYPVLCSSNACAGGTNDGKSCTVDGDCTGGGHCGCGGGSTPTSANGCNDILNDLNVVPQPTRCTTAGCGSGFEGTHGTRNIDFDVMEIDNGGKPSDYDDLRMVRRDWLSILNQGIEVGKVGAQHQLYGTGVSDSHRLVIEIPGYSRTYVGAGEFPTGTIPLDVKAFNQEVLAGNMTATTGPYITFTANNGAPPDVNMGETLGTAVTSVDLKIKVQAAPWVPVDEVRLIKNGRIMACYNTTTTPALNPNPGDPYEQVNTNVVRFDQTITDSSVTEDSYYIVEAGQSLPTPPTRPSVNSIVGSVASSVISYGFTNPIFVDGDGDDDYTGITLPGGSGEPVCPALPVDCSSGAITQAMAPAPATTMFAAASQPPAQPKGFFRKLISSLIHPAVATDDAPPPSSDAGAEAKRQEKREKQLRHPEEHLPWHLIEFPTPRPDQIVPEPQPSQP